jgi:DNA-binding PadR family transcriptional regulator
VLRLENSLTHGNLWLSILSILSKKKAYAYTLPDEIARTFSFKPSKLMTYFVLYKLEDEGLISSKFEGRRKYYELAAKGRRALAAAKKMLLSASKKL